MYNLIFLDELQRFNIINFNDFLSVSSKNNDSEINIGHNYSDQIGNSTIFNARERVSIVILINQGNDWRLTTG